jgi:hypothetical protein
MSDFGYGQRRLEKWEQDEIVTDIAGKLRRCTILGKCNVDQALATLEAALDQALSALEAAEFLLEATVWPRIEYASRHPLTQEVAQNSQLRTRRIRVHAAVARALEAIGGNMEEGAAEIAFYREQAEEKGNAALWNRRAAQWAELSDPRESLRHWRRVRDPAAGVAVETERAGYDHP